VKPVGDLAGDVVKHAATGNVLRRPGEHLRIAHHREGHHPPVVEQVGVTVQQLLRRDISRRLARQEQKDQIGSPEAAECEIRAASGRGREQGCQGTGHQGHRGNLRTVVRSAE